MLENITDTHKICDLCDIPCPISKINYLKCRRRWLYVCPYCAPNDKIIEAIKKAFDQGYDWGDHDRRREIGLLLTNLMEGRPHA